MLVPPAGSGAGLHQLYGGVSGFLTILCKQWCAPGTETPPPTSLFPQACNQRITVVKLLFACFRLMSEILQHVFQLMQAGKAVLKHFFGCYALQRLSCIGYVEAFFLLSG
ncbi:hypothetical protein AAHJ18_003845 [Salmonella enterica]